jgi:hypothetical protein
MKVQPRVIGQRPKIDVKRASEPVPTRKPLLLLTLEIPKRITDVLEVESHTAIE